ncbi:kinase-like domain-containing protein [Aspergillus coremiiformis]|uniref:non-specific serine/threonine protein kinase n=1 Tax=Aspergillus coremiiformis TaxID=138285 RepID=A0A5N6ZAE2_9EURO|nr:kinase-like domain-containing protein [Aspergillus coremiiformis]
MNRFSCFRRFLRQPSPPRIPQSSGFPILDSTKMEEERMPAYNRGLFYPVKLGDVFVSRYQVLSKLGFGANSTVWFCRDLCQHRYIALKIYICGSEDREVRVLKHLSTVKTRHPGPSFPDIYRAPEVILGMSWTSKADIWNVGVLVWDLFEDHHLFDGRDLNGNQSDVHLLAEMIAMLGPPQLNFLRRSPQSQKYWDPMGQWKAVVEVPQYSLEESEEYLEGENKKLFMQFIRKMLRWDPEERQSACELLSDPWLNAP